MKFTAAQALNESILAPLNLTNRNHLAMPNGISVGGNGLLVSQGIYHQRKGQFLRRN